MPSTSYILLTIIGCGLVTWLSRIIPFVLLKKVTLPKLVVEYLQFVPIVIMAALWFDSLLEPKLGQLPQVKWSYVLVSLPTVLSAIISKNLFVIVLVGIASLALFRLFF
ncbi:AzlD domain-containing protein [Enterococcus italicus]|uniref:AzlD domain-containing protein n=1 Tax=Enterococcus italicus TaxID=246144 RepID=UPI002074679E|nr:AzlD domain-containing protein [Enterococcus italicus]MCM6931526.1 AzlD domain-containing protein [Enterococcus italicus]